MKVPSGEVLARRPVASLGSGRVTDWTKRRQQVCRVSIGPRYEFTAVAEAASSVEGNTASVARARRKRNRRGRRPDHVHTGTIGTWEARPIAPVWSPERDSTEGDQRTGSKVGRGADWGVVPWMTAKDTSRTEGRLQPQGSPSGTQPVQTQRWSPRHASLVRVNDAAIRSRQTRFTALVHHLTREALERAFRRLRRKAAPGGDGITVADDKRDLEANLQAPHARLQANQYRPRPVRRTYIPKADGGQRALGLPAIEDKIVQGAGAEVLNAIYEADFHNTSFGFRPGRSAHDAIMTERVGWVVDADIRNVFDHASCYPPQEPSSVPNAI